MRIFRTTISLGLLLAAVSLLTGTFLLKGTVPHAPGHLTETVIPNDSNFLANPGGNGEMLERLAEQSGKPCDLIFIGASNVEYWNTAGSATWNNYYAPRHAFNFGVAGDTTQNVLWRFDHTNLSNLKPKVGVIFVGLNNLSFTPQDVALGVEAVVQKTQAVFPGIKVLVVSLTPNGRNAAEVPITNQFLRRYADEKNVFYVDLYAQMPREGKNWKGLGPDRLHLTAQGYEMWSAQMEPLMQKLLPLQTAATAPHVGLEIAHR